MRKSALALAVVSASVADAQVQTRTYTRPEIEYAEAFSQVAGIRELSDGRVIVSDSRDKTLQLIDLKTGATKKIGREGSGPGEWISLSRLLAVPGDTTLMPDSRNSRMLVISPDGTPVRTITPAAADAVGGVRIQGTSGMLGASVVDSRGRLYYTDVTFSFSGGGPPNIPDSMPIVRHDIRTLATDTIAFVKRPPRGPTTSTSSGTGTIRTTAAMPFTTGDAWTVLPDGRVAIARPGDYHVEIVSGKTSRTVGPRVAFTPIPVGPAEKKAYLDNLRANAAGRQVTINGVTQAAPPPPEPTEWPATMPAFLNNAAFATPTGEVWIQRARASNDQVPTFDVFNGDARNIARVVLPKGTTLVGFGPKSVYLVRTDDDGLQYLQKYAMIGG